VNQVCDIHMCANILLADKLLGANVINTSTNERPTSGIRSETNELDRLV